MKNETYGVFENVISPVLKLPSAAFQYTKRRIFSMLFYGTIPDKTFDYIWLPWTELACTKRVLKCRPKI